MRTKVVQTRLSVLEYEMLRRYAESRGLTIAEALREMVRRCVLEGEVDERDPLFAEGPAVRGGRAERTSEERDKLLYGEGP